MESTPFGFVAPFYQQGISPSHQAIFFEYFWGLNKIRYHGNCYLKRKSDKHHWEASRTGLPSPWVHLGEKRSFHCVPLGFQRTKIGPQYISEHRHRDLCPIRPTVQQGGCPIGRHQDPLHLQGPSLCPIPLLWGRGHR